MIRLEWLRHTGASPAYAATGDLKAVARRLRHRDTRMVDHIYVRAYEEGGRETADAIDELATALVPNDLAGSIDGGLLRDLV